MKWQALAAAASFSIAATSHAAERKYGAGVTDTEIQTRAEFALLLRREVVDARVKPGHDERGRWHELAQDPRRTIAPCPHPHTTFAKSRYTR
jgi:hypothetical protein